MTTYAKFRTDAVVFNPIDPTGLPNNTMYTDSTDSNLLKTKDNSGSLSPVSGSSSLFNKVMQSGHDDIIPVGVPVSKTADGKIIPADSDAVGAQEPIGISMVAFPAFGDVGVIHLFAPNVTGVLTGMGFLPGQEIFLGETGGYTNNPNSFTGDNDSIIRIGIADCSSGTASAVATDLIINTQVILRP